MEGKCPCGKKGRLTIACNECVEGHQGFKTIKLDIKKIRKEVAELYVNIVWYHHRGGLLPYDWNDYGQKKIDNLRKLCRLDKQYFNENNISLKKEGE